jgi:hypothetical protein
MVVVERGGAVVVTVWSHYCEALSITWRDLDSGAAQERAALLQFR